jgi:hypothetical protein
VTLCTGSGALPSHLYVWVNRAFIRNDGEGFEPAVWFGLQSKPGQMWGCHVMLESGAVYRGLPPHALAFSDSPEPVWSETDAQRWDCYGLQFSLLRYDYLDGLECIAKAGKREIGGDYLFTAVPIGDGFSRAPDQSKEFMFVRTDGDRLTVQPTNTILFRDRSFTVESGWPSGLKPQTETYSCEHGPQAPFRLKAESAQE